MQIIDTASLTETSTAELSPDAVSNIYCGLDCAVTMEIRNVLRAQIETDTPNVLETYRNALAKQAPVMEMSMRGFHVDEHNRQQSLREMSAQLARLEEDFAFILKEGLNHVMNWRSPLQLKAFFYTTLGLKPVRARNSQGEFTPTINRDALEKLSVNFYAELFCNYILAMRDLAKQIGFLKTEIDEDQRIRCSFNIAGTNTGRLASSMNEFGTGTNLQNVSRQLRFPFVADPKKILVNVDLEQADARNVGAIIWNIFVDEHGKEKAGAYLDACESGDLHTTVCRMAWPELSWPENPKEWRAIADQPAYRDDSYRQLAKKLGHGTNYLGQPKTMARHTKTDVKLIEEFQARYFTAYPLILEWHKWIVRQVTEFGYITTQFGRRRYFFDRADAAATHREATAYEPQSMTAHEIDMGFLNLWRHMPEAELLVQVHDSITLQIPNNNLNERIPRILELLRVDLPLKQGRLFTVPLDAKVGWNWGDVEYSDGKDGSPKRPIKNLYGLDKWKFNETRLPPSYKVRLRDYL